MYSGYSRPTRSSAKKDVVLPRETSPDQASRGETTPGQAPKVRFAPK